MTLANGKNTPSAPPRNHILTGCSSAEEQRMEALRVAMERRAERASLRKGIETGDIGFDELLDSPPEVLTNYSLIRLLTWIPYVGQTKAKKIFERTQINRSKLVTLGALTRDERRAVYAAVEHLVS